MVQTQKVFKSRNSGSEDEERATKKRRKGSLLRVPLFRWVVPTSTRVSFVPGLANPQRWLPFCLTPPPKMAKCNGLRRRLTNSSFGVACAHRVSFQTPAPLAQRGTFSCFPRCQWAGVSSSRGGIWMDFGEVTFFSIFGLLLGEV